MAKPTLALECPRCHKLSTTGDLVEPGMTVFFAAVCPECKAQILVVIEFEPVEVAGESGWQIEITAVTVDDARKRWLEGMEFAELAPREVITALKRLRTAGSN